MEIEVGKIYRTRDGEKAWVLETSSTGFSGVIRTQRGEYIPSEWWKSGGKMLKSTPLGHEIVGDWSDPLSGHFWCNVMFTGDSAPRLEAFLDKSAARQYGGTKCVARLRVEWVEGQFEDEDAA